MKTTDKQEDNGERGAAKIPLERLDVEHPDYEQMLSCVSVADLAMVLRECAYSLTIVGMVGLVYINIA